jgi:hypothetical protein
MLIKAIMFTIAAIIVFTYVELTERKSQKP